MLYNTNDIIKNGHQLHDCISSRHFLNVLIIFIKKCKDHQNNKTSS